MTTIRVFAARVWVAMLKGAVAVVAALVVAGSVGGSEARAYEGWASWYGPGFYGNYTASGDVFTADDFTCAHNGYSFGTVLGITYDGRYVECVVTDTGGFGAYGREIDLGEGVAEYLGVSSWVGGPDVALVDIQVVDYDEGWYQYKQY